MKVPPFSNRFENEHTLKVCQVHSSEGLCVRRKLTSESIVCTVVRQFSCAHCGIQTSPRSTERRVSEKTCVQSCWRGGERERKVLDITRTFFEVNSSSILYFQYVSSAECGQSHV